jgi:hypothetical protein
MTSRKKRVDEGIHITQFIKNENIQSKVIIDALNLPSSSAINLTAGMVYKKYRPLITEYLKKHYGYKPQRKRRTKKTEK